MGHPHRLNKENDSQIEEGKIKVRYLNHRENSLTSVTNAVPTTSTSTCSYSLSYWNAQSTFAISPSSSTCSEMWSRGPWTWMAFSSYLWQAECNKKAGWERRTSSGTTELETDEISAPRSMCKLSHWDQPWILESGFRWLSSSNVYLMLSWSSPILE